MASKVDEENAAAKPAVAVKTDAKNENGDTEAEEADLEITKSEEKKMKMQIKLRQLYVGNVGDILESSLRNLFGEHGEIESIDFSDFLNSKNCIITFKEQESVAKCVALNQHMLEGKRLRVSMMSKHIKKLPSNAFCFLLSDKSSTEEEIHDQFSKYGELTEVNIAFPHAYISYAKTKIKAHALKKCLEDKLAVYDIHETDHVNRHLEILRKQKFNYTHKHRVCINNLPSSVRDKEDHIRQLFDKFGNIENIYFSRDYGYKSVSVSVVYSDFNSVGNAISEMNQTMVEGRRIHVVDAYPSVFAAHLIPNYKTSVYIKNLNPETTEEELYDEFIKCGEIEYVTRRHANEHGMIIFKGADSVEKAITVKTINKKVEDKTVKLPIEVIAYNGPLYLPPSLPPIGKRKSMTATANNNSTKNEIDTFIHNQSKVKKNAQAKNMSRIIQEKRINENMFVPLSKLHPAYVANIHGKINEKRLKDYFETYGKVKYVIFLQNEMYAKAEGNPPRKLALVYFISAEGLKKALNADKKIFYNKRLHVVDARTSNQMPKEKTILVTGLKKEVTEETLFFRFSKLGGPVERVVKNCYEKARICYKSAESVSRVLAQAKEKPIKFGEQVANVSESIKLADVRLTKENIPQLQKVMERAATMLTCNIVDMPNLNGPRYGSQGGPPPQKIMRYGGGNDRGRGSNYGPGNVYGPGNGYGGGNNFQEPSTPSNSMSDLDTNSIEKLLQVAFMSGKSIGETLATRVGPRFNDSNAGRNDFTNDSFNSFRNSGSNSRFYDDRNNFSRNGNSNNRFNDDDIGFSRSGTNSGLNANLNNSGFSRNNTSNNRTQDLFRRRDFVGGRNNTGGLFNRRQF